MIYSESEKSDFIGSIVNYMGIVLTIYDISVEYSEDGKLYENHYHCHYVDANGVIHAITVPSKAGSEINDIDFDLNVNPTSIMRSMFEFSITNNLSMTKDAIKIAKYADYMANNGICPDTVSKCPCDAMVARGVCESGIFSLQREIEENLEEEDE